MADRVQGRIIVRFRREQDALSIRRRCERLRIGLARAVYRGGPQRQWMLEVTSSPAEAAERHRYLAGAVIDATVLAVPVSGHARFRRCRR